MQGKTVHLPHALQNKVSDGSSLQLDIAIKEHITVADMQDPMLSKLLWNKKVYESSLYNSNNIFIIYLENISQTFIEKLECEKLVSRCYIPQPESDEVHSTVTEMN